MTQSSMPQTGHLSDGVSPDAGPYSAPRWSSVWTDLLTSHVDQGPIGIPGDTTLEPTNPSGATFNVAAGNAMVGGRVLQSSAQVAFSSPTPSANPRIDVIVAVQNESSSPVTAGIASGNDLVFPTSLTDYDGSASIPPYSCRLAILKGTEAATPTAPTLDQNPDLLYMIPIASYEISTVPAITDFTDLRTFTVTAGSGALYVPQWYGGLVETPYSGRVKVTPFYLEFAFGSEVTNIISFASEPDPQMGVDEYASFWSLSINDFELKLPAGAGYTLYVSYIAGGPTGISRIEFQCTRNGYVDNTGTAQPVPTASTDIEAFAVLIQLMDEGPIWNLF